MTINEANNDIAVEDIPPRPMTAQEFYADSYDLLDDNTDPRPSSSRPPTGHLQAGTGLLRACTPSRTIHPSPVAVNGSKARPGTGMDRPSTADLPLLRPSTSDTTVSFRGNQKIFSPKNAQQAAAVPLKNTTVTSRPSTGQSSRGKALNNRSATPSGSRFDNTKGAVGGLGVSTRPQSRDSKLSSTNNMKKTMFTDTVDSFFESGFSFYLRCII